jgi:ubiquitin carboxyl-terminal hydrolase L3
MSEENKDMPFAWPPLESNPEIFTSYMHEIGLPKEWAVGELFGFDEDLLAFLPQPVLAVIANVERPGEKRAEDRARGDAQVAAPFYMKQTGTLDNACGVIACIHAIYNNLDSIGSLGEGSVLANHLAATQGLSPEERCAALESNTAFQTVHKGKALQGQSGLCSEQSDVHHHFVAFVRVGDNLVELDGTKQGPLIAREGCTDVLRDSVKVVQERLAEGLYTDRLSLMALNANAM